MLMQGEISLTDLRADALTEMMNLGMARAANALNQLVGAHITLNVPRVKMLRVEEAQHRIESLGWIPLSTVQMEFDGSLKGTVALIFPGETAVQLVGLLTGDEGVDNDVDALRKATLEETGNILLNGVVGAVSNLLNHRIRFTVPHYRETYRVAEWLTSQGEADAHVVFSTAYFNVAQHRIQGEILLYFEIESLETLLEALDRQMTAVP